MATKSCYNQHHTAISITTYINIFAATSIVKKVGQIIEVLDIFVERRRASHFKGDKDVTSPSVLMGRNMMP